MTFQETLIGSLRNLEFDNLCSITEKTTMLRFEELRWDYRNLWEELFWEEQHY